MADLSLADHRAQLVPLVPPQASARLATPLPAPLTSFVGREREVAAVCALLQEDVRLLTLIGPGGVGKTRLAIRIAMELAPAFPDGVAFVGLAPLTDPDLVLPTIAQALGLRETGDRPLGECLGAYVGARRLLLVLDNMERLVDAAPRMAELLRSCPGLTLLVTSRMVLRLSGEHVYPVSPLAVPAVDRLLPLDEVAAYPAVVLFVQRARAADPAFTLTAEQAVTVGEIVRRLDGLPLAIELAAARVRALSPSALLGRLTDRLRLLTGGPRDQPARLQTMRDAIAWSHDLLTPAEQALLSRLSVFVGGCTLEAAEAVAGAGDPTGDDVDQGIASLLDKSLLQKIESAGGPRYVSLEMVRQFAWEHFQTGGDRDQAERAHAAWCLSLAEAYAPWHAGKEPMPPPNRLEAEVDNLRSSLAWAIQHREAETAHRIAAALHIFWNKTGRYREGLMWARRALALPGEVPPVVRAFTLLAVSSLTVDDDDPAAARPLAEEGLAISQALGDVVAEVWACFALAEISGAEDDLDQVQAWFDRALVLARAMGARRWVGRILTNLGSIHAERGDHVQATALMEESLRSARASNDRQMIRHAAGNLAGVLWDQGQTRLAAALRREELGLSQLGDVAGLLFDSVDWSLCAGLAEPAARLLGASAALRAKLDAPLPPSARSLEEQWIASSQAALGKLAFEAAWAAGAALPVEAAVAEADAMLAALAAEPVKTETTPASVPGGLTPRELEVVRLVAAGRSNREIAEGLFISPGTATIHVRHILAKLDLTSRTAVAAWAVRHGLA